MIDWSSCSAGERHPQHVSGVWVFRGTRVPVAALFENLEDGAQITQFVEWFPGVLEITHLALERDHLVLQGAQFRLGALV
jgi:hypothetical protein